MAAGGEDTRQLVARPLGQHKEGCHDTTSRHTGRASRPRPVPYRPRRHGLEPMEMVDGRWRRCPVACRRPAGATTVVGARLRRRARPLRRLAQPPRPRPGGRTLPPHRNLVMPSAFSHTPSGLGGTRSGVWRHGRGGPLSPTSDAPARTALPANGRSATRSSGPRWSERPTCRCVRIPSGDGTTRRGTCRVPGRPAMTRPHPGIIAASCSPGTGRRSPWRRGRSGRASRSRPCCSGAARVGRSSRC
jgi:hypothetical protein